MLNLMFGLWGVTVQARPVFRVLAEGGPHPFSPKPAAPPKSVPMVPASSGRDFSRR